MKHLQITSRVTPRDSKVVESYLRDIARLPLLTADEEVTLAERIQAGDEKALERLVQGNLRFVVSVAKCYQDMGLELADLISVGNMGLITAARRFEPTRGFKFTTYAVWWIRQSILSSVVKYSRMVALPANQQLLALKIAKANARLEQELQRIPTSSEISDRLQVANDKVARLMNQNGRAVSLDAPREDDEDGTSLLASLPDANSVPADHNLMQESMQADVAEALKVLPVAERQVVEMSFGIGQQRAYSLEEIALQNGLSRERVRQIKGRALMRLQRSSNIERLKTYL